MKHINIKLNGLKHRIATWGSPKKPKLFLIHGWMEMGSTFNFLCEHLEKDFYCIAPDLRGFGHSQHTKNKLGYFFYEYIGDVHALLNHFSPNEPVDIVGHSMGGNMVSIYAGTFPERIRHFINSEAYGIMDMPGELGPERMRTWLEEEIHPFKAYKTIKEIAERFVKANPKLKHEYALFLARHMSKKVRAGYQIAADPKHKGKNPYLFQMHNIIPFWQKITASCLLAVAQDTEMGKWLGNPEDVLKEVERRLSYFPKNSQKITFQNCGHMIHHEKPQEFANAIKNFLL
ncbi:alpha/beta hydrolase [bacterium]|nr:alpha/beta hydrolase [bacterium]